MNRIIRSCVYSSIFLWIIGCNSGNADVKDQQHSIEQIPVFDIAMQGVNPAWFVRAMEGVDFGIHRVERYGELVADSSELLRRSLEEMDRNDVRLGLLSHGAHKEAWHAAHPERFLLSFEPDLSLEDVVIRFPELNIVMMHMGWPFFDHALYGLSNAHSPRKTICPSASAQVPFPTDTALRALLERVATSRGIKGIIVGLLDETGTRRVMAHGDPGSGARELDGESVFEIGSMTKVFTGILLADMVRRGEVELTDSLAELLPPGVRVPERNGKPITLLDLTTHFSGLPGMPTNLAPANPRNPFVHYTVSRMYEFLSVYELPRNPGDAIEYSNIGMALLGHALALRTGAETYEVLAADRILRPLGMTHTAVTLTPLMRDRLVRGHDRDSNPVANWDFPETAGMGGLRSTANDMLTFAEANLSTEDTGLTSAMRASHQELRQAGEMPEYPGIPVAFNDGRIGFNWFISRPGECRITWSVGLTAGYSTFLGLDLEARRAVVVLTNTGFHNVDYLGFHLLDPTVPLP